MALRKTLDYTVQHVGPLCSHKWRSLIKYLRSWIGLSPAAEIFTPDRSHSETSAITRTLYSAYAPPQNPRYNPTVALANAQDAPWIPDQSDAEPAAVDRQCDETQWPLSVQLNDGGVFTDLTALERSAYTINPRNNITGHLGPDGSMTDTMGMTCDSVNWLAQGFTPDHSGYIWSVTLKLYRVGSPGTNAIVSIRAVDGSNNPTGPDLCSKTFAVNGLSASPGAEYSVVFDTWLNNHFQWFQYDTRYAIVVRTTGGGGTLDMGWRGLTTGGSGYTRQSADSGVTWSTPSATHRLYYKIYQNDQDTAYNSVYSGYWEAQTFTAAANGVLRRVMLKAFVNFPDIAGLINISIRATAGGLPSGADLGSMSIDFSTLVNQNNWQNIRIWINSPDYGALESYWNFEFPTPVPLTAGTTYAIVVHLSTSIPMRMRYGGAAISGQRCYSSNSGVSWTADAAKDYIFEIHYTTGDVELLPAAITVGDDIAFGFASPFDILYQDIQVAGAGTYTVAWEYSQGGGAWAACADLVDGTNAFKTPWLQTVTHTPQGDWAPETLNGVQAYYIRMRIADAGAGYSQPKGNYALVGKKNIL